MSLRTHLALLLALPLPLACAGPGDRALTAYVGQYMDAALVDEILISQPLREQDAYLAVLAYSESFHSFADGAGQWEWEVQAGQHFGEQTHQELNGLVVLRWKRFPWSDRLRTSLAIGEGLSLATEVPPLESASQYNEGATELLNYILLEATVGLPGAPHWDFVLRIHHRSGVFGLFDGVDGGSNVLALGLKYTF
jgi:hypothetical protein